MITFEMAKRLKEAGIIIPSEKYYRGTEDNYSIVYPGWDVKEEYLPADVFHAPDFNELWRALPPVIEKVSYLNLFKSTSQRWEEGRKNDITVPHDVIGYSANLRVDNAFCPEKPIEELAAELYLEIKRVE